VSRRTRLALFLYGAAAIVYAVDRVTKWIVERHLADRPPIDLIPGVVRLRYTTNTGGAFGLFGGHAWLFFLATVVVCMVIVWASTRLDTAATAIGLGLILGGALGNLTDRLVRGHRGVVDFIDFRVWPVFNAADSAIVIGALVVAIVGIVRRDDGADR
jgi:signal peptidase II